MSIRHFFGPRLVVSGLLAAMGGGGYAAAAIYHGQFGLALAVWSLTLVYFLLPMANITRLVMIAIAVVLPAAVWVARHFLGSGIEDYFLAFAVLAALPYLFVAIPALCLDGELRDALSTSGTGRSWGQ